MPIRLNTYKLHEHDEEGRKMKATVYAVEANDFEKHVLWEKYAKDAERFFPGGRLDRVSWKQDNGGWLPRIGTFGSLDEEFPVSMSMFWAEIEGHLVLFYWLSGKYCDHDMSRAWLFKHMPQLFPNGVEVVGHLCDANNFHQCINHLADLNKAKAS